MTIGRRFTIHHGYAVVISKRARGNDFTVPHGVTIGIVCRTMACPDIQTVSYLSNAIIPGDITLGTMVVVERGR